MTNQDEIIAKLERLQQLRDAGVLTQAELEAQKSALLSPSAPTMTCLGCGAPLRVSANGRCIYCGAAGPSGAPIVLPTSRDALADAVYAKNPTKKIQAIKELREATGLSLKEAKDQIDAAEMRAKGAGRRG